VPEPTLAFELTQSLVKVHKLSLIAVTPFDTAAAAFMNPCLISLPQLYQNWSTAYAIAWSAAIPKPAATKHAATVDTTSGASAAARTGNIACASWYCVSIVEVIIITDNTRISITFMYLYLVFKTNASQFILYLSNIW
jgi:hypothetical protein